MIRAHILFQDDQYRFLKARARETGISISALVRDVVERLRHPGMHETAGRQDPGEDSLLGLFADEPELIDEVCRTALEERASRPLRASGG